MANATQSQDLHIKKVTDEISLKNGVYVKGRKGQGVYTEESEGQGVYTEESEGQGVYTEESE